MPFATRRLSAAVRPSENLIDQAFRETFPYRFQAGCLFFDRDFRLLAPQSTGDQAREDGEHTMLVV
jgi:hypothetical protein